MQVAAPCRRWRLLLVTGSANRFAAAPPRIPAAGETGGERSSSRRRRRGEKAEGAAVLPRPAAGRHTFGPANSKGTVGPNLGTTDLSKDEIEQQVRNGGGGMPPFGDRLSDAEIAAVADTSKTLASCASREICSGGSATREDP